MELGNLILFGCYKDTAPTALNMAAWVLFELAPHHHDIIQTNNGLGQRRHAVNSRRWISIWLGGVGPAISQTPSICNPAMLDFGGRQRILGDMPHLLQGVKQRLHQKDKDGHCVSVLTGSETDGELRRIATHILDLCEKDCTSRGCPFVLLHHLTPDSLKVTLDLMKRDDLLEIFQAEKIFRQEHFKPHKKTG